MPDDEDDDDLASLLYAGCFALSRSCRREKRRRTRPWVDLGAVVGSTRRKTSPGKKLKKTIEM